MRSAKDTLRVQLEPDLIKALNLVNEFRQQVLRQGINPVAARIAIRFMDLSDMYFAKTVISPQTEIAIEEIALDFYEAGIKDWEKRREKG